MGLSDDLDEEDIQQARRNQAAELAHAVQEAIEIDETARAVECVSDLLGALHALDAGAFDEEDTVRAKPAVFIDDTYTTVGVHAAEFDTGGKVGVKTDGGDDIAVWAGVPDSDGSAGFELSPDHAMALAEVLRDAAARSKADAAWEY